MSKTADVTKISNSNCLLLHTLYAVASSEASCCRRLGFLSPVALMSFFSSRAGGMPCVQPVGLDYSSAWLPLPASLLPASLLVVDKDSVHVTRAGSRQFAMGISL